MCARAIFKTWLERSESQRSARSEHMAKPPAVPHYYNNKEKKIKTTINNNRAEGSPKQIKSKETLMTKEKRK